jgi:hypothetical protein
MVEKLPNRPLSPKCVCALQWPFRVRNSLMFNPVCAPKSLSYTSPKEVILTPEIRFPAIPLLRLELPKTENRVRIPYAFFR